MSVVSNAITCFVAWAGFILSNQPAIAQQDPIQAAAELAKSFQQQGNHAAAIEHAERATVLARTGLGPEHVTYAEMLVRLGYLYENRGRYSDAEPVYKGSLAIREKALGTEDPGVAHVLTNLGRLYLNQKRLVEAETSFKRALAIWERKSTSVVWEKRVAPSSPDWELVSRVAHALDNVAHVYFAQGRYALAEPLYKRAFTINESTLGQPANGSSIVSRNIGNLEKLYDEQGRFLETEALYKRILATRERATELGSSHPDLIWILGKLVILYEKQKRSSEVDQFTDRALAIVEETLTTNWSKVDKSLGLRISLANAAGILDNMASAHWDQSRFIEVEKLLKSALRINEKMLQPTNPRIAHNLYVLGLFYHLRGDKSKAEEFYNRSVALLEGAPAAGFTMSSGNDLMVSNLENLAVVYEAQGQHTKAREFLNRCLNILEILSPTGNRRSVRCLRSLGRLELSQARWGSAYDIFQRTVGMQSAIEVQAGRHDAEWTDRSPNDRDVFLDLVVSAWRLKEVEPTRRDELNDASFVAAQSAIQQSAGAALTQMAARFIAGKSPMSEHLREQQDAARQWGTLDKQLMAALSAVPAKRNTAEIGALRAAMAAVDQRLVEIKVKLAAEYPGYSELASPTALPILEAQRLLGPNEALIAFLTSVDLDATYVWAITSTSVSWQRIALGTTALRDRVSVLRKGLDCQAGSQARRVGECSPWQLEFNLDIAYELYKKLLDPVSDLIADKRHLIIVPSGALTSLPFNVLVSAPSPDAVPKHYASYRDPAWLIKRQALTILPSVGSLRALRILAATGRADKVFIGFGDPIFSPGRSQPQRSQQVAGIRAFSSYFNGRFADHNTLASLDPLPDTAIELKTIARILGVSETEVYLKERATETIVKQTPLERYRIVHFATHGLVAGDLKGLAEPALALSVPREPSEFDDGLLTASEAAQLKLNADWVILSACNTAAGDTPGAEALSGLARAFFYAGARALLVSHWPVESNAAVKLTTRTFAEIKANRAYGRAEALRQAMLALMSDRDIRNAHPALWAPFMVVGEGGPEQEGLPRLISGPTLQRSGGTRPSQ